MTQPTPTLPLRAKITAGIVVVALLAGVAATLIFRGSNSDASQVATPQPAESGPPARPVAVVKVTPGRIARELRTLGTVAPLNVVAVQAQVDGQITAVLFTEGQRVNIGDALFRIDSRPYQADFKRATAGVEKNQADLQAATLLLNRLADLNRREPGTIPEKDMDAQRTLVASLSGALSEAQAQLDSSRLRLNYTSIRSPIAGRVGKRLVDAGNVLRAADGTKLTQITQMRPIAVDFSLPQEHLTEIRALERTRGVHVDVRASGAEELLDSGKVTFLGDSIAADSGSITLRAEFANQDEPLWPGQLVDVRVTLDELSDALVIPQQAIRATASGPAVFVVDKDSRAQLRPVSIGIRSDGRVSIQRGLSAGETVVVSGVDGISADMRVSTVNYAGAGQ